MNKVETWMFREKGERLTLIISIIVVLTIAFVVAKVSLAFLIGGVVIGFLYIKLVQAQYIGNALTINEYQFPEIYDFFIECKKALSLNSVELCIKQDPEPNAFTIGFPSATIIITSSLVENLSEEELKFVIAHEMGHVKAGHNKILTFINPLGNGVIGASQIFSLWQRKAEYSADKCSLILNKKLEPGIMSLLKISVGLNLAERVDLSSYKRQLINSNRTMVRFSEFLYDHPLTTNRVNKLVHFWRDRFVA